MNKVNTQMLAQIMSSISDFDENECYLLQSYINALKASRGHNAEHFKKDTGSGSE